MKTRLITSIFLALLYVGLIVPAIAVDAVFYDVLVLIFMFTASYEMMRVIEGKFAPPIKVCVYIQVVLGYVAFRVANWAGHGNWGISASFGTLIIMIVISFIITMFYKKYTMSNILSTIFILIYPLGLLSYLLAVNYVGEAYREAGILFVFGATSLVDSMALFIGSAFKGKKLAPQISPNKTISGAIGGLIGGVLSGIIIYLLMDAGFLGMQPIMATTWQNLLLYSAIGLGVSVACQSGDLIASYIKRYCAVKDYSNFLPGHGGFMDRIDGVLVAGIFVFGFFAIFKLF
ncbi:MAG: phosphatidate cytidylyltransferase [Clostridia bacterium]|nr:phosphatidate cytidylyltransferase [Clostridia bacterium]